jgi:hypothetical protein
MLLNSKKKTKLVRELFKRKIFNYGCLINISGDVRESKLYTL